MSPLLTGVEVNETGVAVVVVATALFSVSKYWLTLSPLLTGVEVKETEVAAVVATALFSVRLNSFWNSPVMLPLKR